MRRLLATVGVAGLMLVGAAGPASADAPAPNATPGQLCQARNGSFIDLGGLANGCVRPTAATEADIARAELLCARERGHLFLAVGDVAYACVLPGGATTLTGPADTVGTLPGLLTGPGGLGMLPFRNPLLGTSVSGGGLLAGPAGHGSRHLLNGAVGTGGAGNGLLTGPGILGLFPIRIS